MRTGQVVKRDQKWAQIFKVKKLKQINCGACAAIVADCDCDQCLVIETDREVAAVSRKDGK